MAHRGARTRAPGLAALLFNNLCLLPEVSEAVQPFLQALLLAGPSWCTRALHTQDMHTHSHFSHLASLYDDPGKQSDKESRFTGLYLV
jgi:hypothetical protein